MKATTIAAWSLLVSCGAFALAPRATPAAEDGAALYKTKCSACHGANGEGKPAMKAPSLVSDEAKKLSDADLTDMVANGGKEKKAAHAFSKKGVTDDQVKAIVAFVRDLQKK